MSEIQQITDYDVNLNLILEQYKKSVNLKGILSSSNDQADDLETALFEIRDLFYLSTATGIQLDIIGSIFGESRDGDLDPAYRARIEFRASLVGSGEPEYIINVLKNQYGATFVDYYSAYPAGFYVVTDAIITNTQLENLAPSGVQAYLAEPYEFEDGTPIEFEDGVIMHGI